MTAPFKWVVEIEVDPKWVEDGFQLTPNNIEDRIAKLIPYANSSEFSARVLRAPSKARVLKFQGFKHPKSWVCRACDGKGYVQDHEAAPKARWRLKTCPVCRGTGERDARI